MSGHVHAFVEDIMTKIVSAPSSQGANETWLPQDEQAAYLRSLTHIGQSMTLVKGASLYKQGQIDNSFYVVLSGTMHVHTVSAEGHQAIINIMGPGSVIGEAAAFLKQPRYASAHAIEPTTLLRFETQDVPRLIREDPNFAMALLYLLSIKQRQLVSRLRQAIYDPPETRILKFLQQFRQTHRDPSAPHASITVNLTHEQIASMTDLSRVTVTRVLGKLKRDGLIDFNQKKIVLSESFLRPA